MISSSIPLVMILWQKNFSKFESVCSQVVENSDANLEQVFPVWMYLNYLAKHNVHKNFVPTESN